ncbi:MAG: hypothetical protein RIC07_04500 [Coleofasciculus sp. E1-EBD-02]
MATHSQGGRDLPKWRTLRDALTNLVEQNPEFTPYSEKRLKYLRLLKSGQNWIYLPENLKNINKLAMLYLLD